MTLFWRDLLVGLAILLAAVLLSRLSRIFLAFVQRRLVKRTETQLDDVIVQATAVSLRLAIMVGGLDLALRQVSTIPDAWRGGINQAFFMLYILVIYLFLFRLIGGVVYWYGREVADKTETELDDRFLHLFRRLALVVLTVVVIVTVMGRFGIEVSALVTTLGIGSLAIALAAQETLGDMISGFTIMIDQPFQVGDRVEILDIDTWGDVIDIGLRSTRILTRDNRTVSVPNSVIGKGLVVNYSEPSTVYRVQTHVGIAYGADIEYARQVMIDAVRAQDWVMQDERIEALFLQFGESALMFRVRCWIKNYVETRRIIDKLNTTLYLALNEAGIIIPIPQRQVHLAPNSVEPISNQ